jgi:hypothetical protein
LPGVPAPVSRGADPVLAGAWCPIGGSPTVEQRAVEEAARRWDGLQGEPQTDCLGPVEKGYSDLTDDPLGDQAGDSAVEPWAVELPAWSRLASQVPAILVGRQADPLGGSAAEPWAAELPAWSRLASQVPVILAGRRAGPVDGSAAGPRLAELPTWFRLASQVPVILAGRRAGPVDGSAAGPRLAELLAWSRLASQVPELLAGRRAGPADALRSGPRPEVGSPLGQDDCFAAVAHFEAGWAGSSAPVSAQRPRASARQAVRLSRQLPPAWEPTVSASLARRIAAFRHCS